MQTTSNSPAATSAITGIDLFRYDGYMFIGKLPQLPSPRRKNWEKEKKGKEELRRKRHSLQGKRGSVGAQ